MEKEFEGSNLELLLALQELHGCFDVELLTFTGSGRSQHSK
jgi:hypothetical protein